MNINYLERKFLERVTDAFSGICKVGHLQVEDNPLRHINIMAARSSKASPLGAKKFYHLELDGWGRAFERQKYNPFVFLDTSLTEEDSIEKAMGNLKRLLEKQTSLKEQAAACGIYKPLEGEALSNVEHLFSDKDALDFLAFIKGGKESAFNWIINQKIMHKHEVEAELEGKSSQTNSKNYKIDIIQNYLNIPVCINDNTISRGGKIVWTHDEIYINESFSDSVMTALAGRKVEDVISNTPIPDRIIKGSRTTGFKLIGGDSEMTIIEVQPNRIKIKDWMNNEI